MFFITAFTSLDFLSPHRATRCFGYYPERQQAVTAVLENRCDLHETIYHYIVVEEIGPGIHSIAADASWFRFEESGQRWEPMDAPKEAQHLTNFTIG